MGTVEKLFRSIEEDPLFSFGNPYFSDTDNYKELEEEVFKVEKNGVKTTIICKFRKDGCPVSISYSAEKDIPPPIPVKEQKLKGRFIKRRTDK